MFKFIIDWWKKRKAEMHKDWASVPNPEWAAKRGSGRDYW